MASVSHYRQKIERSCICVFGVSILPLSSILIVDFGIYYFLHFTLNLTVELDNDLVLVCHNFIEKSQNNLGHDIAQILLKLTLNTNQSNQSK